MAEIEIIYRKGYCQQDADEYCLGCHTEQAEYTECPFYTVEPHEENVFPFMACYNADFKYAYKGYSGAKYEICLPDVDRWNPHLDSVTVKLGNKRYDECVKVILNGRVVFNKYDDEESGEMNGNCSG